METLRKYWFLIVFLFGIVVSVASFSIKFYYADKDNIKTTIKHTEEIEELKKELKEKIKKLEDRWTARDLAINTHLQAYGYHLKECSKQ